MLQSVELRCPQRQRGSAQSGWEITERGCTPGGSEFSLISVIAAGNAPKIKTSLQLRHFNQPVKNQQIAGASE